MTERLKTQKDNLAKLLAKENLTIVHRKVPTAYFDLKNRLLCCPILKEDISSELYDLFMGHEVSHALNTPYEGVHSAVTKNRTLKGYLNVVEDVRIERMIKDTYPGLRKSFFKAYNELMDIDFFGIKEKNLQELSLIDKINLITKCGSRVSISLNKEEQFFLDWAIKCQTWEEVEECATAIYEWSKENETRTIDDEKLVPQMFDIGDDEESEDEEENMEDFGEDSDSYEDPYEDSNEDDDDNLPEIEDDNSESGEDAEEDDEESEERKSTGKKGGEGLDPNHYDDEDGARESITEHNAHNNEEQFISEDSAVVSHINMKEVVNNEDIKNIVYPYKQVRQDWKWFFEGKDKKGEPQENIDKDLGKTKIMAERSAKRLVDKNKKIVMHMAKEFEMKAAAFAQAHAFTGKTGKLDMNRLAKYQIVDDVFKRMTYLPDGKNHGVQVMLDWSGSISNEVMDLLEQSMILAMFCKKVDIPFRVYLFSDQIGYNESYGWDTDRSKIRLVEMLSNEMKSKEYLDALAIMGGLYNEFYLQTIGSSYNKNFEKNVSAYNEWFSGIDFIDPDGYFWNTRYNHPNGYGLGGTPLDQCLVGMRRLIPEFNKQYGIEKSILTIITDGYSHRADCLYPSEEEQKQITEQLEGSERWSVTKIRKLIDPYSGKVYDYEIDRYYGSDFEKTTNLLEWLKAETGVITTGYFVCGRKSDFLQLMSCIKQDTYEAQSKWLETRRTGTVWETKGYGKLFTTASTTLVVGGEDELDEELVGAKKGKLTSAFKKNQKTKTTSRFLTNEFIKEIA